MAKSFALFRRRILTSALLLISALSWAQSHPSQPADQSSASKAADAMDLVKRGQKLASAGKPDEALALYQQALALDPDLYDAQLFMGVALDLQGKYTEARQHLSKAIELASEQQTVQSLRVMAVSYAFERNTDKASEYERRAFDLQTTWKRYEDAAATANELARIYLESGDLDNAFQWYQTGRLTGLKKPNITDAEKDLWTFRWEAAEARIAARRGKKEEAQQHLAVMKGIIEKNDNPDQAHFYPYLAGYVALYAGDYSTAIKQLQQSDQTDPFVLSLIAQAYEKSGDKAQAIVYYQKILTVYLHNPSNAFARPMAKKKLAELAPAATTSQVQ
jgi:tetratricopeptide (TPR) repeat protein